MWQPEALAAPGLELRRLPRRRRPTPPPATKAARVKKARRERLPLQKLLVCFESFAFIINSFSQVTPWMSGRRLR
jgi:hypothetical protein